MVLLLAAVCSAAAHPESATPNSAASAGADCDVLVQAPGSRSLPRQERLSGAVAVPSLAVAQQEARRIRRTQLTDTVTVCLGAGTHNGGNGLRLTAEDSGTHWFALDPRRGATVVSGGTPVGGWAQAGGGVYVADLPASLAPARNLWVNGVRMNRTRVDGASLGLTATAAGYETATAPNWSQPDGVELLYLSNVRNWIQPRCLVGSMDAGDTTTITVQAGCWKALTTRHGGVPPVPTAAENVGQPQRPGEFFADFSAGKLYLYPPAGVDPSASGADVVVGTSESLLNGTGVHTHSWSGVTFQYSTWSGVGKDMGYVPSQSAVHACSNGGSCEPVGAVHFTASVGLTFANCTWQNHGAVYGLGVGGASSSIRVHGCTFYDLSGGAVKLGNVDNARAVSNVTTDWDMNISLSRSTISHSSLEYLGAAAVFAGYVADTEIDHNSIFNTGYSGVSLGWGWGSVVSFARNNRITNNHVYDVMRSLVDGGCIYTLGPQPNSTVANNYAHDDHNKFAVLYHDNGSRYFTNTNNVVGGSPAAWAFFLQGCCGKPALDIAVSHIWWKGTAMWQNNCAAEGCTVDKASVHELAANAAWPAAAQTIIDNAGASAP